MLVDIQQEGQWEGRRREKSHVEPLYKQQGEPVI